MKKLYFLLAMLFAISGAFSQSIFTNPITDANPSAANPFTAGQTIDANITVSGIGRGTGISASSAANRYSATGWNTTSTDPADYYEFTLTPNSGFKIDFVSFVYTGQASGTGPTTFAFRSSVDSYVGNIGTATTTGTTLSLSAAAYQGITSAITFRFYGWNASAAGGTFSINDFTFNGTVSASSGSSLSATGLTAFGNICTGTTTSPNSFTINGSGLTAANVTVAALTGFTYSTTSGGTYTSTLTLPQPGGAYSQDVYVKFSPTLVQSYNGNIVVGGGGASDINVAAVGGGTNTIPNVTSQATSAITGTTATINGTITVTGCTAISAYGVEYSTTSGFTPGTGTTVAGSDLNIGTGVFTVPLTGLAPATTYYFKTYATNGGGTTFSSQGSFITQTPEPTNHTTAFACGTTTSGSIPLSWTDATGGTVPFGYLIKTSTVGYGSIADPVDGTPEPDAADKLNIAQGVQAASFTGLAPSTIYYFKIFPYTNAGATINYKIDGTVPQTSCTTLAAPIAAWDFTGNNTATATVAATSFDVNLVSTSGANNITRGAGAAANAAGNSFRTTGFQNDGIVTTNTDYFQVTLGTQAGFSLSLSSINARFAGTASFAAAPGVSSQFAYSLDGTNFTLIGSPVITTGTPATLPTIDLSGEASLQNVPGGTTITIRYYASGQTTTGGWGFTSPSAGAYGLAFAGSITASATPNIVVAPPTLPAFTSVAATPSAEQSYTVSGTNLTSNIVITPPVGFEVSTTSGSGFVSNPSTLTLTPSGGTVATTTVYVRMNSATLGANSGNITNASTGATTKNVALTGKVLAAEPSTQSAVTFGTITANSVIVNFTGGNGAKRIVLAKSGNAVDSDPVDGITYTDNAAFASGTQIGTGNYTVYAGTGNTVTVTGLNSGITYHFAVYEYNDGSTAGAENYLITAPGTGNATTTVSSVTYTWVGGSNSWTTAANWSPVRTTPVNTDVLQFNDGATVTITDVPTETIGQLSVSAGSQVTLSSVAAATLTIGGLAGTDLIVDNASGLNITGTNALVIAVATGATGAISNTAHMNFAGGAHKLTAADASGISFGTGCSFTTGTGFTGNPFGAGTANSIVFASGSSFIQLAGSNPFALTQPASVIVLQTGSLFKLTGNLTPSLSGRTYANFELDAPAASINGTAAAKLSFDNLVITNGSLNLGLTGTPGHSVKGNISVNTGATLNLAPATAGTLLLNGTAAQSISNSGTLTFGNNQSITVNNSNGVTLNTNIALGTSGTLTLTSGNLVLGNNNLSATTIAGGSGTSYIKTNGTGTVTINNIAAPAKTFPVGNAKYNPVIIENGSDHNWSVRAADTITADPGFNTNKAVLVSWIISPSVNPPAAGADITFQFDEATQVGPSFSAATNVQAWRRPGAAWVRSGAPAAVNTSVPNAATVKVTGLTGFSQYGLSNIDGALPVNFGFVKATQQSNTVKVQWSNMTETEVMNYAVEHSADGRTFVQLGQLNAALNNGARADYSFMDLSPVNGINYYRIRSLETTGKTKYSIIVKVDIRGGATQITLYPNPVTDGQLSLQATSLVKGQYTIRIINAAGQQVYSQSLNHTGGSVTGVITLPAAVKPGMYTLQLNGDNGKLTKTFLIQ